MYEVNSEPEGIRRKITYSVKADWSSRFRRRVETDRRSGGLINVEANSAQKSASLTFLTF